MCARTVWVDAVGTLLCVKPDAAVAPASVAEAVRSGQGGRWAVAKRGRERPGPDGSTALHWAAYQRRRIAVC
jgi:hypothetical protein